MERLKDIMAYIIVSAIIYAMIHYLLNTIGG